jgi:hypothetical protein
MADQLREAISAGFTSMMQQQSAPIIAATPQLSAQQQAAAAYQVALTATLPSAGQQFGMMRPQGPRVCYWCQKVGHVVTVMICPDKQAGKPQVYPAPQQRVAHNQMRMR